MRFIALLIIFLFLPFNLFSESEINFIGSWDVRALYSIRSVWLYDQEKADSLGNIYIVTEEYDNDPQTFKKIIFHDEDIISIERKDGTIIKGFYTIANLKFFESPVLFCIRIQPKSEDEYIFAVIKNEDNSRLLFSYQLYELDLKGDKGNRGSSADVFCQAEMIRK